MPNLVFMPNARILCWKLIFENQLFLALFSDPLFFMFPTLTEVCVKQFFSFFVGQLGLNSINKEPIIFFQPKIKFEFKG